MEEHPPLANFMVGFPMRCYRLSTGEITSLISAVHFLSVRVPAAGISGGIVLGGYVYDSASRLLPLPKKRRKKELGGQRIGTPSCSILSLATSTDGGGVARDDGMELCRTKNSGIKLLMYFYD